MRAIRNITFTDGLRYPWGRPGRLWNILWVLLPIIGWFALAGYGIRIVKSIIKGNHRELPEFGDFWSNCKSGFIFVLRLVPIYIVIYLLNFVPFVGWIIVLLADLFLIPYLFINMIMKEKVSASFEIHEAWDALMADLGGYIKALVCTILYYIIYGIACIVLVGIPCLSFGAPIYMAVWYANHNNK